MALYKTVNGELVLCSVSEEDAIQSEWTANDPSLMTPEQLDAIATSVADRVLSTKEMRFLFEILYNLESRLRVREGAPAITRIQYKNALIDAWKTLA